VRCCVSFQLPRQRRGGAQHHSHLPRRRFGASLEALCGRAGGWLGGGAGARQSAVVAPEAGGHGIWSCHLGRGLRRW
jgi:hypothetical protein